MHLQARILFLQPIKLQSDKAHFFKKKKNYMSVATTSPKSADLFHPQTLS